jgi:hypothetical protein
MVYRNWRQPKSKINKFKNKNLSREAKHKDEMKSAIKDEENLKRKKKRLTFDWFFRPQGD